MTDVMTAGRRLAGGLIAGALILLVLLAVGSADTANANHPFNPSASVCLDDFATAGTDCDGSSAAGASSDFTTTFGIGLGPNGTYEAGLGDDTPDSNFGGVIGFVPEALSPPADADIPDGAVVARLFSFATLAILQSPCNQPVNVEFIMIDATTNTAVTIDTSPPEDKTVATFDSEVGYRGERSSRREHDEVEDDGDTGDVSGAELPRHRG